VTRESIGCRNACGALALLTAILCLWAPSAAFADAYASFEDGNRLFRDDLYWAALLRYGEAADAGLDTPILHFNTGVAHYKAQQHIRARTSLLKAAEAPQLRVISHFNLGLNAYASGDADEAVSWFRRARDQQENEKIRELAMIAITRIQAERRVTDPVLVREDKRREEEKPPGSFEINARLGIGSDDNIFRAPSQPYIDLSDPTLPVVVPEIFSGTFVPVDFQARYTINSLKWENFFGAYRLSGRFYDGDTENNADEYVHEFRFGSEYDRREGTRRSRVYSAFAFAQHDEQYVDPDTGNPRTAGGQEITDRMNYKRFGPQMTVLQGFGKFTFGLRMKAELWDYEDTEIVPEYDHEYFLFGGNFQYKFAAYSLLRLTVEKSSRRYSERPSFDLNGNQLITNPALRYDYLEYGLLARQRITEDIWFGFGYELMDREDRYQGYNDFTRDTYSFEFHWSPGRRFDLELHGYYRNYDYPNAFAFHDPAGGEKTLETADAELLATWRLTTHFKLVAEVDYRENTSSDFRIGYDRTRYSLGLVWEL
jgi:tetratricopeptide (TPR) repeat protein